MRKTMHPPSCPAKGLRSIRFFTPANGITANPTRPFSSCATAKWLGLIQFRSRTPDGTLQELGDATMLSNGNIVFCRKVGASEVTPDKKIIWNMDAPKGTEIHSIQPIGLDHVLVTHKRQSGGKVAAHQHDNGQNGKGIHVSRVESGRQARTSNSAGCMRRRMGRFSRRICGIKKSWNMTRTSKKSGPTRAYYPWVPSALRTAIR